MAVRERLGVVGAGTMGNGIAHVMARADFEVVLCEVNEAALERGLATIRTNLDREQFIHRAGRLEAWHLLFYLGQDPRRGVQVRF